MPVVDGSRGRVGVPPGFKVGIQPGFCVPLVVGKFKVAHFQYSNKLLNSIKPDLFPVKVFFVNIPTYCILMLTFVTAGAPQGAVPTLDGRIVGGRNASISDYPYQVSLQFYGYHFCGGSIISSTWVLTAAHCTESIDMNSFTVRAGSSSVVSGGQVLNVLRILIHPQYDRLNIDYDISLVELASPIDNSDAHAISLPSPGSGPIAGATCTISGWGNIEEGGGAPTTLQVVEVPVVSQDDCRLAYGGSSVTDRMFCAGVLGVGGKDSCQGDSGGPAVVGGNLVGIVSWGYGCARPDYPGIYTNVANLRSWIKEQIGI
ncbi:hypothetical protein NQ317_004283 [Molorchus minor]|uniref:Peptidase S1 domain-containing protein n=1 Tax=Molorchus minor TaxID=1323400 RepID=A0ABQ9JH49_9CUCU|nr:hypothetical protein NQ317_004283 [Molorchus minor]